jgi:ABC-2 type transport system permease protein
MKNMNFKNLKIGIKRELDLIAGDHSIILTVLIAPLLYAMFLGTIYLNKEANQIAFGVVDRDKTSTTRTLTRLLAASPQIKIVEDFEDYDDAVDQLYEMNIESFIYFPRGFEKNLKKLQHADVKLYLNTTRFLPSNEVNKAVQKLMLMAGAGVRLRYYTAHGINPKHAIEMVMPLQAEMRPLYNPTNNYGDFLLPGLFLLIIQQTLLLGLGESFAKDGETKILKKSLSEGAVNYITGKTSFYFLLYNAYFIFFLTAVFPWFGLPVKGDLSAIFVMSAIFIITIIFMAALIGSFIKDQKRYMEILAFSTYPFFLVSGYSWPVSSMPFFVQWISALIPTTPFFKAFIKLTVMDGGWQHIMPQFINLLLLCFLFGALAFWRLRYLKNSVMQNEVIV